MHTPKRRPQSWLRVVPPTPTSPRFDFLSPLDERGGVIPEPAEITAFKSVLIEDPLGLKKVLDAMRRDGKTTDVSAVGPYVGVVTSLVFSTYWTEGRMKFDATTEDNYLNDPTTRQILGQEVSKVETGSLPHAAMMLELRAVRLATFVTRVATYGQPPMLSYGMQGQITA